MSKKKILALIACIIFGSYAIWQLIQPNDSLVNVYKWRYDQMSKQDYIEALKVYCSNNLNNSINGMNYTELLAFVHKYLMYNPSDFERRELPIDILNDTKGSPYGDGIRALGRCGEFSLLYNGLLLANGYKTRLVVDQSKSLTLFTYQESFASTGLSFIELDCKNIGLVMQDSVKVLVNGQVIKRNTYACGVGQNSNAFLYLDEIPENGSAIYIEFKYTKISDDHVWIEVWVNNRWIHIDPTENRIDQPKMYVTDWNKEINNIVAITKDDSNNVVTVDVTKDYQ